MVKEAVPERPRICNRCGSESSQAAQNCSQCGAKRFAPPWVLAKKPITRWTSVEVTETNPRYGDVTKRVTLSKWWPTGRSTFHLPRPEMWDKIRAAVDELGARVGWMRPHEIATTVQQRISGEGGTTDLEELDKLASQYPELVGQLLASFDPRKLGGEDVDRLAQLLRDLAEAASKGSAGFRDAFVGVLEALPQQGKQALDELENLLRSWSLHQVTAAAHTVKTRLDTIELFRRQVEDDRTFELKGDTSIHRILEREMWLIDERYWLLKSNKTLRNFIGSEMSKRDRKRYGSMRPDFVCGSVGSKLIIVELKRPGATLKIEDLNQLETYLAVAEDYSQRYRTSEAYLVGNKTDSDLLRRMKYRSRSFKILTYSDLIDRAEDRYRDFLGSPSE